MSFGDKLPNLMIIPRTKHTNQNGCKEFGTDAERNRDHQDIFQH